MQSQPSARAANLPIFTLPTLLTSHHDIRLTAEKWLAAFQTSGFLYLTDYSASIPDELVKAVFSHSQTFFDRSLSEKDELAWTSAQSNRGYAGQGRENLSKAAIDNTGRSLTTDMKESYQIGRDDEQSNPNHWPTKGEYASDFKAVMQAFFSSCQKVHRIIMSCIAIGLKLPADYFDDYIKASDNTLRLLHYPATPPIGFQDGREIRAGEHSDYGSITLLFQDAKGGLQVEHPKGTWLHVEPLAGSIVVNAGDLLARWSNDLIKSTRHRVIKPSNGARPDGSFDPRYSVAYFCSPDFDKTIEVLPGTWEDHPNGKKYNSINSGEYLVQRLTETY